MFTTNIRTDFMGASDIVVDHGRIAGFVFTNECDTHIGFDRNCITVTESGVEHTFPLSPDRLAHELTSLYSHTTATINKERCELVMALNGNWIGIGRNNLYFGKDTAELDDYIIFDYSPNFNPERLGNILNNLAH